MEDSSLPSKLRFDKAVVAGILDVLGRDDRYTKNTLANMTFERLRRQLDDSQNNVVDQLCSIKPAEVGVSSPFVTLDEPPDNLTAIEGQSYLKDGQRITVANQYLPEPVYEAFLKMREALNGDTEGNLIVESGYRSPAHQVIVFLTYLEKSGFDIRYVATGVALPGYSQHGDPAHTAMDVLNQDGIPTDEEPALFAKTKEYRWLLENAGQYGFELSYPEDNKLGMKFEPWHWRYVGQSA